MKVYTVDILADPVQREFFATKAEAMKEAKKANVSAPVYVCLIEVPSGKAAYVELLNAACGHRGAHIKVQTLWKNS